MPSGWQQRVLVFEEDFCSPDASLSPQARAAIQALRPRAFWHCAASVQFTETATGEVWDTNVNGLQRTLELASDIGASVFNHVSTAYVAGTLSGRVPETIHLRPETFNNVYEESKLRGEHMVDAYCRAHGLGYRIFRPSVIIGHTQTCRSSSNAGMYRVLDLLEKFHEVVEAKQPGHFQKHSLKVGIDPEATCNLIPVDLVAEEMLSLAACGDRSLGRVFHITNERTLKVAEFFEAACPLAGIGRFEIATSTTRLSAVDQLFRKGLTHYSPYFNCRKTFDRTNGRAVGVDRLQADFHWDQERLKVFIQSWLARPKREKEVVS